MERISSKQTLQIYVRSRRATESQSCRVLLAPPKPGVHTRSRRTIRN